VGSGGVAEVYLAEHPRLPRRDALKLISSHMWISMDYVEGTDAAQLVNPSVDHVESLV
jgi:serine/threonine protein kinase